MSGLDRRTFLTLSGAAGPWTDSLIVNALGGLEDPNPERLRIAEQVSEHDVDGGKTRNKTDEELRLVASKGGASADDVVAHIDHAVNICGEEVVGIGTDGSVTAIDDLKGYREALAKENAERRKAGISAAGEGPDTLPFVVDLRGVNELYSLADRLRKTGYSEAVRFT